jgi:hypothetical protein
MKYKGEATMKTLMILSIGAVALLLSGCVYLSPPYGCPMNCDDYNNHPANEDLTTQVHSLF